MSFLTKIRRSPPNVKDNDNHDFPTIQLFLLALVRVAEPIALTSLNPYAWRLVLESHVTSESNAPFVAGVLISAFSLTEACSGMYWGGLSDRIGRKPVLIMGCFGTISSLLLVGLAPNFWVALAGRIIGGALNGNIGVIQTMVGELVKRPEHEAKAFSVMPCVWSIGTIIGPSIGGYFAEPTENFPSVFSPSGLFGRFPYLLPNLICSSLLVLSIVMAYLLLEETHPDMQPWSTPEDLDTSTAETPLLPTQGATDHAPANLTTECYGTFNEVDVQHDEVWRVRSTGEWVESPRNEKVFTKTVVSFVVALGIFTYHSMTYDHLLPIFFQDKRVNDVSAYTQSPTSSLAGGLGLSTQDVGVILSINGIIQLAIQAFLFPALAEQFGVWKLLVMVTIAHPVAYFIVPFLQVLPPNWLYTGIFTCLSIRNITSILAFPLLLIMIKEVAPDKSHLGKINGLAASTGAACRTIASPVAGLLYGISIEIHFTPIAYWASALVAMFGALQIPFLSREARNCQASVQTGARCCLTRTRTRERRKSEVIHITIDDVDETDVEGEEQIREAETV